ncbi:hypothetical protein CPB83DRAFT_813265 [Crepidotus variabilis]|uniref:Ubiquitin carboxyl-terminal hydrolase n=1 Tax=Crepidotus variabilis TaxID=179855 RepID=A0A9P6JQH7_9AGAR|nr:hypothetical protein CPB83DRAFT_813265 [Crepidotus variabilis]
MPPLQIQIKHSGKSYPLTLDTDLPPAAFKDAIYQKTGVPVERMKVMVKGGVLKDDSSWSKIAPKEGQTFMVIGAAGDLPKPPEKPIVFLEDMDDSELAAALAKPVGLANLGNTCYMNATVQALRAVPELQIALAAPSLQSTTPLPTALRDLYAQMSKTTDSIVPSRFLGVLREVNPQFAEMDRSERTAAQMFLGKQGYAQQDAEECYNAIINTLRNVPGLESSASASSSASGSGPSTISSSISRSAIATSSTTARGPAALRSVATGAEAAIGQKRFVEQWLMGEMRRELKCDESTDEPPVVSTEQVLKVDCNINMNTNFMLSGILQSLDEKITKHSPSLGREAVYTQKSRMSRLPTYLTVHMVRFAWRGDIGKKAKIMRKVKFPEEFDALDLVTDELKNKLLPASRKLKEIEKERFERRKVRARRKGVDAPAAAAAAPAAGGDVEMSDASELTSPVKEVDEFDHRERESGEYEKLVNESVKKDVGASETGLYDLVAIVTHKGAAADAGHYIGFVKKSVFHAQQKPKITPTLLDDMESDEDWYKFDDDKVSVFPREKLGTLDGGGEDSSAYVLLYRSKTA